MRHAMVMEKHAFPEHPWAEPPMPIWFKNHAASRIFSLFMNACVSGASSVKKGETEKGRTSQPEVVCVPGVVRAVKGSLQGLLLCYRVQFDFKIDTLIGPYNPDWAFVTEREERLYFVRETKSTLDSEARRTRENQKTACGKRHIEALEVNFDVVTGLSEVKM